MIQRFIPKYVTKSISRKLIFLILLFSSIITLILTATQLWLEFDSEVSAIHSRLIDIDKSFTQTITQQVWNLDREQMEITANGLFQLPYVDYVRISGSDMDPVILGETGLPAEYYNNNSNHIRLEKDLYYESIETSIGHLSICTSLDPIYSKLFNKILITLVTQGIKTFLVSLFMLIVFNLVVVKHLVALAKLADDLTSENLNEAKLLQSLTVKGDEIDTVISSINLMITRLRENYNDLKHSEQELKEHRDHLEEVVERRTSQLKSAKISAEQANEAKSLFLASMSHELRTPLNSIILLSGLMAKNHESNLDDDQIKKAKIINSSGKDLLSLVTDLLDLSKIEAGKMTLEFEDFTLSEILQSIETLFSPLAIQKGINLSIKIDSECSVRTDREKLLQILNNIIGNAIKFTNQGEVSILLEKITNNSQGEFCITVKDTGIGISASEKEVIFELFQQANNKISSEFGGTGLGLAISKKLADLLKISIEIDSEIGKGSTFKIFIPSPQQIEHTVFNIDIDLSKFKKKLNIAVIDDDQRSLVYLQNLLETDNIKLECFECPHVFLDVANLNGNHWDITIIDFVMPEIDGFELFKKLKQTSYQSKFILLTGHTSLEQKKKALEVGFDSFVPKPINLKFLKQEILRLTQL
ncbi:MAG: hypothetical protein COW01_10600 [Bdellovibrionales bacterium CG12_big_fil_rev_8_21_14_0_65_38_15]|nr:MAG: hypothetical protein COW79_07445 [Bdellovibrionales bacterium CG22_combo_CG10-13_8_21_14_all_38_13]PIQ54586.1 MAG: hypothetical protein COW01_10600 [Bdellovibrionales bacterium CG12_big_fil_rev_8_21_14_0_65_38_15]PIR29967.1 MAG: hypothetical protein COV38_08445 [Bdellovibrionales bacterium CG11_big_fil_rev_8_21_14_0_20_38_13]